MQIVSIANYTSIGDNLYEMSKPIFWKKIKMSSAEIFTQHAVR